MTENMHMHLKYFRIICIVIIACCLIGLIISLSSCSKYSESDLQVGQTWVYTPDDPFESKQYRKIVDIKDDYVQYHVSDDSTMTTYNIESSSIWHFLHYEWSTK